MSKASQRRQAAQKKRETEVRGSPEKRARMLLDQYQRFENPVKWWRDCIKHLPADEATVNTPRLCKGINHARRIIEIASTHWDHIYDLHSQPDVIMPGFLLMFPDLDRQGLGVKPLSLVGMTRGDDIDLVQTLLSQLPEEIEGGLWVFGATVSGYCETFVLAAHRDGTRTAACHVQGQWLNKVPTFFARYVAWVTMSTMVEEMASEPVAFAQTLALAAAKAPDALDDVDSQTEILKDLATRLQVPYMEAWWRMAINQYANETADGLNDGFTDLIERLQAPSKVEEDARELRQRLAASKEREQALLRDLRLANQERLVPPAPSNPQPVLTTAAQRLSSIF
jgi:hypothetical protein